jgi:acyl transferase domain-containing protein
MFTGQGAQYVGMGRGLYDGETAFRRAFDRCAEILRDPLDLDLRDLIFARSADQEDAAERLRQTSLTQPSLFSVEYALAALWRSWGVEPASMIGHSVGEYVAACLAGVFSLEDALTLVAERGRLMQSMPPGSMLAVPMAEEALRPSLTAEVDVASLNAPSSSVVSGPEDAVARLESELLAQGVMARRLHTSHAFHSAMMDPILGPFEERVSAVERRPPQIPFVSNVTGSWISPGEATEPSYWARHLRQAVRFFDGVRCLREGGNPILLEVGPGNTLATLARQHGDDVAPASTVVQSLRHPREDREDRAVLLTALGRLWVAGAAIDWSGVHEGETRRRVPLPTYPFERQRFWVDPKEEDREAAAMSRGFSMKRLDVKDWFYQVSWRRLMPPELMGRPELPPDSRWLVFLDEAGLGEALVAELRQTGRPVATVRSGRHFGGDAAEGFVLSPRERADYVALAKALADKGQAPTHVVHLFGVDADEARDPLEERLDEAQGRGFYSLLFLAQALVKTGVKDVEISVVTNGMQEVVGGDLTRPEKATALGPCRVVPQEHQGFRCRSIDLDTPPSEAGALARTARRIMAEAQADPREVFVAYRGGHRWVQSAEPTSLPPAGPDLPLEKQGVYLITGGQGGIGLSLARYLAEHWQARLVLTGRSSEPRGEVLRELEALGAEVLYVPADSSSRGDMETALARTHERFGPVKGVVHSAGVAGGGIVQLKEPETAARVMAPKLEGTAVLAAVLWEEPLDFFVLCSSTAALLGGFGQVDYCAANCFLDAFSGYARARGLPVQSINWDAWKDVGMAVNTPVSGTLALVRDWGLKLGISPEEGVDAFCRVLASGMPHLATFTMDIWPLLLKQRGRLRPTQEDEDDEPAAADAVETAAKPEATGAGGVERMVINSWEKVLGCKGIGLNDNFFELGGDSLTALQAATLLKAHIGRDIPVVTFYDAPTVALLARAVGQDAEKKEQAPSLSDVEQRAETRLDLMRRRRRARSPLDETRPLS